MSTSHKYTPVAVPVGSGDGGTNDSLLDEQLIATPVDTPSTEAQPYLEVVAPATLPEVRIIQYQRNLALQC